MKPTPLLLQHLLLLAIAFANSPVLRADPLAELGGRLEAMAGTTPIEARVELRFSSTRGDDDDQPADPPASIAFEAEANAGHMQLVWSRSVLAQAASEAAIRDPEAPRPVTRALAQVSVPDIDEYLNAAPRLRAALAGASVSSDQAADFEGRPARRLELVLDPPLGARERKYIKDFEAKATIWLAEDGTPMAAERRVRIAGRAMLVISFTNEQRERFVFARHGDRLVVVEHDATQESEGGGESGTSTTEARIAVMPATP